MATTLFCLALAIFSEARGEPTLGQEAVAHVIMNRAEILNMQVCEVVVEKGQFSWNPRKYIHAVKTKAGATTYAVRRKLLPVTKDGWAKAVLVAQKVLLRHGNLQRAEFFHAKYVNPPWKTRMTRLFSIGNHVFYARKPLLLARN